MATVKEDWTAGPPPETGFGLYASMEIPEGWTFVGWARCEGGEWQEGPELPWPFREVSATVADLRAIGFAVEII